MDAHMLAALSEVMQVQNIFATFVGVVYGLFIGAMPGLTISLGMVLLLPLTFKISAVTSVCLLLGLYAAGMTGGSFSAVLINIPGTPSASATALDGYEMAKNGRAGEALGVSVASSFFGGIFGLICLVVAAPLIARVALNFGAPELFAIVLLGLTLICGFGQESTIKGLISGVIGLVVMTVGLDPMMGTPRFTFNTVELQAGISFLPAMIGLFAIPQILVGIAGKMSVVPEYNARISGVLPKLRDLFRLLKSMLIGSLIGTGIGAIPGTGGPIAVFLSYEATNIPARHPGSGPTTARANRKAWRRRRRRTMRSPAAP
jgi:putative tricarboxylic transport membrane protein